MRELPSIHRHVSTPKIPELFISELGVVERLRQHERAAIDPLARFYTVDSRIVYLRVGSS